MRDWQTIESAPKDGTYVLIASKRLDAGCCVACWDETWCGIGWWLLEDGKECDIALRGDEPTHWQPLPPPPKK